MTPYRVFHAPANMPRVFRPNGTLRLTLALAAGSFGLLAQEPSLSPHTLMPRTGDYTLTWWAEGFPGHSPAAPWRRVVQTGAYAFALDTDTLRLPHFGPVPGGLGLGYPAAARHGNRGWQALPPAELVLTLTTDGKPYRGTAGG